MSIDVTPPPPPPPKRRRVLEAIKAPLLWLKNRRAAKQVAKALTNNQIATAALAASVAAAGLGTYAAVEAVDAQHQTKASQKEIASLKMRYAALSADLDRTRANVAGLFHRTADLESASAIQLRALGFRTSSVARELSRLADQVAGMPSSDAQTAALAASVAEAASQAHRAMRKAEKAATAAAEADDDEFARAAAAQAAVDAGLAAQQAAEAQRVAENAQADADAAQVFPRTVTIADVSTTQVAGPVNRTFTVDLPRGVYDVRLTADVDCGAAPSYIQISAPGMTTGRVNSAGPESVTTEPSYSTGGGTTTFTLSMDATVNLGGSASWRNITITFFQEPQG